MQAVLLLSVAGFFVPDAAGTEGAASPESRALAYLAREVPRWSKENRCFSCHNNGDGARALYAARRPRSGASRCASGVGRFSVPEKALAATSDWLERPQRWDHIDEAAGSSDKVLARIQFAAALTEAVDADSHVRTGPREGAAARAVALAARRREATAKEAAQLVAELQKKDGSWQVEISGNIGSPATYGPALATSMARRILQKADAKRYQEAIAKADRWLEQLPVKNVLDAAAVLLTLEGRATGESASQRRHCLGLIRKGEAKEGGWGPYVNSSAEPFDTAVALLALSHQADEPGCKEMLQRGRAFLTATQQEDGSWKETTRPAGATSYAQRISTTAWATLALLATSRKPK